ncbi:hypothetical protein OSTOST_22594, partial [Ostertagia ostertagi]
MSVFPAFPTSTEPPAHGQEPVPHCDRRQCAVEKGFEDVIYSTTTLKILESVTTIAVFLVSTLLLLVLLIGRRRFTVPFFRILTVLVTVIVTRSVVSIAFKLITLWTGVPIASQNIITLVVDIFSKKMIILLIFLLALNRFAIILYPILDSLLFARLRKLCKAEKRSDEYPTLRSEEVKLTRVVHELWRGVPKYTTAIASIVSLVFAFASVCLHLTIIVHLRCQHRATSVDTAKVQQRMFREVALMTLVN